jgi:hypothetical protein
MSLRPAWTTEKVQGQPGLYSMILHQNKQTKSQGTKDHSAYAKHRNVKQHTVFGKCKQFDECKLARDVLEEVGKTGPG